MNENIKKQNMLIRIAKIVGCNSVGKCGIWFNQPKIPKNLKK